MSGIFDPGIFDPAIFDAGVGFTANAVLRKTRTASFTANASISVRHSGSFTADSVLRKNRAATVVADAVLGGASDIAITQYGHAAGPSLGFTAVAGRVVVAVAAMRDGVGQWTPATRFSEVSAYDTDQGQVSPWDPTWMLAALAAGGETAVDGTFSGGGTLGGVVAAELSGADYASVIHGGPTHGYADLFGVNHGVASDTITPPFDARGVVFVGFTVRGDTAGNPTPNGWTLLDTGGIGDHPSLWLYYRPFSRGSGPLQFTTTIGNDNRYWVTVIAAFIQTPTGAFTADSVLRKARTGSFTADAFYTRETIAPIFLNAALRKTASASFSANAYISDTYRQGAFSADAVLHKNVVGSFTAAAWIKRGTTGVTGEAGTVIRVGGRDVTDDVVFADATFTMLANGAAGSFRFRVRDRGHAHDFTSGAEVTLDIEGIRKFGGFLTQPSRMFAFDVDNTTNPNSVARFWVLTGVDYNILFDKRVVYDKANPANVTLRSWPAGSDDDVVIKYTIDHYTDLGLDGVVTDGVTHVGSPNPDRQGVIASGGLKVGDAMREINRLISGVFYIDPYKNLTFVDVDIPNASKAFSDRPTGGGETGYREFEHIENGANLVNDALVWGAAAGSDQLAFSRVQSAPSQAAHGLWQFGEFTAQLYRQSSVDQRADSIVNGTPQSKRGGKDDQVSWAATTFDKSFSLGEKVQIESEVWGVTDVVPIRRITISFPVKRHPKFQLVLSHEIDEPWNLFEFYRPRFDFPPLVVDPPKPFDSSQRHWYSGTFTFGVNVANSGSGLGTAAAVGTDPNSGTVYTSNPNGAQFEQFVKYTFSVGIVIADSDGDTTFGLNTYARFPLANPGGGNIWRFSSGGGQADTVEVLVLHPLEFNLLHFDVIGVAGTVTFGAGAGDPGGSSYFVHQAATVGLTGYIGGPPISPHTAIVFFWWDPEWWVPSSPVIGQLVINDVPAVIDPGFMLFQTSDPYEPGTLRVFEMNDIGIGYVETFDFVETDPLTGLFTLGHRFTGYAIYTEYTAAAGAPNGGLPLYGDAREVATRVDSTHYQLSRQLVGGSSRVWADRDFQYPGMARDYTEDPDAGQIVFNDPISDEIVVWVDYYANGAI